MNRLSFFKWLFKGAAAVVAAPLAKYLPESVASSPVITREALNDARLIFLSTPRMSNKFFVYKHSQYTDTWPDVAQLLWEDVKGEEDEV